MEDTGRGWERNGEPLLLLHSTSRQHYARLREDDGRGCRDLKTSPCT